MSWADYPTLQTIRVTSLTDQRSKREMACFRQLIKRTMVRYGLMEAKDFSVIELADLKWPTALNLPTKRFRLFVAADFTGLSANALADFGRSALRSGMVFFCAWGHECEKFHDIVDEVIANDYEQNGGSLDRPPRIQS
jgi:hypothetical protein